MSIDVKKLSPADLKKLAESAKKSGPDSKAAIEKAKRGALDLLKDAKLLDELDKKNPDI